jgi:hypothetical protein
MDFSAGDCHQYFGCSGVDVDDGGVAVSDIELFPTPEGSYGSNRKPMRVLRWVLPGTSGTPSFRGRVFGGV